MALSTVLYSLTAFIGLVCLLTPPSVASVQGKTLSRDEFALQVTLPTSIGMLLLCIGYYGFIRNTWESTQGIDEASMGILIACTAIGGIGVSLMALVTSFTRMYWAAD